MYLIMWLQNNKVNNDESKRSKGQIHIIVILEILPLFIQCLEKIAKGSKKLEYRRPEKYY